MSLLKPPLSLSFVCEGDTREAILTAAAQLKLEVMFDAHRYSNKFTVCGFRNLNAIWNFGAVCGRAMQQCDDEKATPIRGVRFRD
jgi:hypothetical protein